jgi:hypothetical protein
MYTGFADVGEQLDDGDVFEPDGDELHESAGADVHTADGQCGQ